MCIVGRLLCLSQIKGLHFLRGWKFVDNSKEVTGYLMERIKQIVIKWSIFDSGCKDENKLLLPVINKDWIIVKIYPFIRKSINNFYLKPTLWKRIIDIKERLVYSFLFVTASSYQNFISSDSFSGIGQYSTIRTN